MPPTVSIIIPTYQGAGYLDSLLSTLYAQAFSDRMEIIAVDSASTDNTVPILEQYGATVIPISQEEFTHGYARNLGVRKAQAPIVVFMSQDALPVGFNWLERLIGLLDDPSIGAAFVRQLPRPDATPLEAFFHNQLYPAQSRVYAIHPGDPIPIDKIFFSNVCSVARRELCLAYPFDERLIMSEDQAFARALLEAGYRTYYSAEVAVIHSHHYSLWALFRRNFDSAYSLRGISQDTWSYTARKGIAYILNEIAYLVARRQWRWLPLVPVYEATRILSRILGKYADRLPYRWRVKFSLHRGYWERRANLNRPTP